MLCRTRKLKSGKLWVGYYYDGRDETGKRKEIPLGGDLNEAKRRWAELDCKPAPVDITICKHIFDRYESQIIPQKELSTQKENLGNVKQLRTMFDQAPISSVTPQHIAQYRDARSAKVRANREISMFSHIFNMAREWGYTTNENPCKGVRKNKEVPRDYYADAPVWDAVYAVACIELQDAMDLAYLTGQRPADTLRMLKPHIQGGFLEVKQGKTKKKLRIILEGTDRRSELGELLDRIIARDVQCRTQHLICTPEGEPLKKWTLRTRFDNARAAAAERAISDGNDYLAGRIREFQFRDIRPKAASEIESLTDASKLLGHTEEEITRQVYRRVGEKVKPTR